MEAMQRYRLRTVPCNTADMPRNTIPTLLPIRIAGHFMPLHSPDSGDSPYFFLTKNGMCTPQAAGNLP